jgi:NAD(P)-dependent dehydrogenase (short-subunit alcohol dehydrogenase family)
VKGKTCVITGATDGIGLEAALKLGAMGARLVLVGRNPAKGEAALARLRREVPGVVAEIHYADLSRQDEIRRLAPILMTAAPRMDVLLNNAGAFFSKREETPEGIERTLALNHLGYFLLTYLLRSHLIASSPARIVNVASIAHRGATLDLDDLQLKRSFSGWRAYKRSKLCNILFTRELARRLGSTGVTANCLHPGFVATSFGDNNQGLFKWVLAIGKRIMAISVESGGKTPVYLAASPEVEGVTGEYFDKCKVVAPDAPARNDRTAALLWQESLKLTGLPADA